MNSSILLTSARGFALAFLCAGSVISASSAAPSAAVSAQVFDPVRRPERIDAKWRANLCALLPAPCEQESLGLFRPRGAGAGDYVLLSQKPLAMARLNRGTDGAWHLTKLNDLTGYKHSVTDDTAEPGDTRFSLAPALYPLAEGLWAVGVVRSMSQGFSGGGALYETADFVPLDDTPAAKASPAHAGVPFNCSQDFRACFTEKEYKTSPHCREQNDGQLRIAYGTPAKAGEPYAWSYTWRESAWPGNEPKSKMTQTVTRFTDADVAAAPFCGQGR